MPINVPNNPPAFPLKCQHGLPSYEGLSLRDYFAAAALQGLLAHSCEKSAPWKSTDDMIERAFQIANRMLEVRSKEDTE